MTGQDRIQPTLFTMQVALAATMKAYGARPGAVIGHSIGEAAAAVVAGALSLEDGVRVICRRSRLMSRIAGAGAIGVGGTSCPASAFGIGDSRHQRRRGGGGGLAGVDGDCRCGTERFANLVAAWQQRDVMAREIPTDVAFHSPQVDPILDELTESLAELHPMTPEIPFYSATLVRPA